MAARKRRRRRHHRRHHGHRSHRRKNPMGDWVPWVLGAGMGAVLTYFYVQTVTTTPQLAAGTTTATKTS